MQIADGIWLVDQLRTSNVYLVAVGGNVVVVDTGMPGSTGTIIRALDEADYTREQVRAIVITHAHLDHIGTVGELQQATGAPICASPGEAAAIEGRAPLPHPPGVRGLVFRAIDGLLRPQPIAVQHLLHSGDSVPHMTGWRVVGTPGHTPDHMSLYHPERAFLLAGDAVGNWRGIHCSPWPVTWNMSLARRSLALLAGLPIRSAGWGHGEPIIDDPALGQRLADVAQRARSRAQRVTLPASR